MGYCGGVQDEPTYKKVCNDADYDDWAEAIQLQFDPSVLSYQSVLDAFFRAHDHIGGGRSRQYSSIIFAHDDAQRAAAHAAIALRPRSSTSVEELQPFWQAEPYHQKWLLQRKRDLLLSLQLCEYDELITAPAATVLNAVAAGKLPGGVAQQRMDALFGSGEMTPQAHETITAALWQVRGVY